MYNLYIQGYPINLVLHPFHGLLVFQNLGQHTGTSLSFQKASISIVKQKSRYINDIPRVPHIVQLTLCRALYTDIISGIKVQAQHFGLLYPAETNNDIRYQLRPLLIIKLLSIVYAGTSSM